MFSSARKTAKLDNTGRPEIVLEHKFLFLFLNGMTYIIVILSIRMLFMWERMKIMTKFASQNIFYLHERK